MDSRYRKFLALVETGSFSAAARSLRVTQPAITLAIASLEHTLGAQLYERRTRPIVLTTEGEIVAASARAMREEFDRMRTELSAVVTAVPPRVGLIDSIAQLLYESSSDRSLLDTAEVMVDNSRRILRDLRAGKIDVGVITGQPTALDSGLVVHKLHDEQFVFVASPERAASHTPGQIEDWLATNPDSTTYKYFLELFTREGLRVTPIFHSASMELLRTMAIAGKGTALLPYHVAKSSLESGQLVSVATKPLHRPIWAATRTATDLPAVTSLVGQINLLLAPSVV